MQWDLRGTPVGGRGRQGRGAEDTPPQAPAAAAPQAGARGGATAAAPPAGAATGGGRGGGRGGFGPAVAPGTYLVKVMIGDKVIGQKTIVVEPDTTFLP